MKPGSFSTGPLSTLRRLLPAVAAVILTVLLGGCQSRPVQPPVNSSMSVEPPSNVARALYRQHQRWQGTPYLLGGMSRSGIDCSGFVLRTFQSQFALSLPRTTADQHRIGRAVSRDQLEAGDLVFFRTGEKLRHVGIYVEQGLFLHASTSRGVMLSRLDNRYWSSSYWKAKRLSAVLQPR